MHVFCAVHHVNLNLQFEMELAEYDIWLIEKDSSKEETQSIKLNQQ